MEMKLLILAVCVGLVAAGDHGGHGDGDHGKGGHGGGHHWTYNKEGADWENKCQGPRQSPIDIKPNGLSIDESVKLRLRYQPAENLNMVHNGHALEVADKEAGFVKFNGAKYNVKQFHFHAPSEHTINGKLADAEMHIVHQKEGAKGLEDLLVIGVMFQLGAPNEFLSQMGFRRGPKKSGQKTVLGRTVDLRLNNLNSMMFHYPGSLTTPTCDPTVSWFVRAQPAQISAQQLAYINKRFKENQSFAHGHGNNRGVQPIGDRIVKVIQAQVPKAEWGPRALCPKCPSCDGDDDDWF